MPQEKEFCGFFRLFWGVVFDSWLHPGKVTPVVRVAGCQESGLRILRGARLRPFMFFEGAYQEGFRGGDQIHGSTEGSHSAPRFR